MEIKIIDEKSGNPFSYFDDEEKDLYGYSRSYEKITNVKKAIKGLLKEIELEGNIDCLEVGAGHNPKPSQSFSRLGAKVITLDADWEPERHTEVSHEKFQELKKKLGKDILIPALRGRNDLVKCYMGDIAFLRDERSQLKDVEFDLIYFWGSVDCNGICSSIDISHAATDHDVEIEHSERIIKPLPALRENGTILSIAQYFNGHRSEKIKNIGYQNMDLAELALLWALAGDKEAKTIGIFTQSPESVMKRQNIIRDRETEDALCKNPLERIIEAKYYSRFNNGEKDEDDRYYDGLRNALDRLGFQARQKLNNLGMIDAVFVKY